MSPQILFQKIKAQFSEQDFAVFFLIIFLFLQNPAQLTQKKKNNTQ